MIFLVDGIGNLLLFNIILKIKIEDGVEYCVIYMTSHMKINYMYFKT